MVTRAGKVTILDVTIRDGSYVNNFQFTPENVRDIVSGLAKAGVPVIEIGHGYGLGASSARYGVAAATDEKYFRAAQPGVGGAVLSALILPGIGNKKDIDLALRHNLGLLRVAPNVTEVETCEELVRYAKKRGLKVSVNLLKSYLVGDKELVNAALAASKYGADIIYLVDSAGGMLTGEVRSKIRALKGSIEKPVGFHAHNNLALALSNSVAAVEAGAEYVDSSLCGMGRSAGNTQTEILVGVLERMGYDTGVDINSLVEISRNTVAPLMPFQQGIDGLSFMYGYAQLHSSFEGLVKKYSVKYAIKKEDIILELGKRKVVVPEEEVVHEIVKGMLRLKRTQLPISGYVASGALGQRAEDVALSLIEQSRKNGKTSLFVLTSVPGEDLGEEVLTPFLRDAGAFIYGVAEIKELRQAKEIIRAVDGLVDFVVVDVEQKSSRLKGLYDLALKLANKSVVLAYKDNDSWVNSIITLAMEISEGLPGKKVVVAGGSNIGGKIALGLSEIGARVSIADTDEAGLGKIVEGLRRVSKGVTCAPIEAVTDIRAACSGAYMLVGALVKTVCIDGAMVSLMNPDGVIIDAGIGSIGKDAISQARKRGIPVYRLDNRTGLPGTLLNLLQAHTLTHDVMGRALIAGVQVVAGGVIGNKGDLIVDSVKVPTQVIGVATGDGRVSYEFTPEQTKRKKRVEDYMDRRKK